MQPAACASRYTGKERDTESGLDYFGARYYASTMGRYMSPDWRAKIQMVPGMTIMTQYLYDAEGSRAAKGSIASPGGNAAAPNCDTAANGFALTSQYVLGPSGEQVSELDGQSNWRHTSVYAAGSLLATYDAYGLHYHFSDPLGTRRVQASANAQPDGTSVGAFEASYQSLPFGDNLISTGPALDPTEQHFTAKERDAESGNDYFGARYYASTMGRFASADPYEIVIRKNQGKSANQQKQLLESFIANPQAWNKYAYGLNNPLKNVDVGGNCSAPAGLQGGQTGVCVEAFIAAPRIGGVGLGDNRTFNPNGGTYRFRVDVRVDSGSAGGVSVNKDAGFSKVGTESVNFGRRGTGDVTLGPVTTDDSGNRHFEVTGTAQNGFEAVNNLGTIGFDLKFTATPDGTVTLDKAMGTTFPSIEAYSYNASGQVTGTLLNSPERQSGDLKKPQQCLGGNQCPQ